MRPSSTSIRCCALSGAHLIHRREERPPFRRPPSRLAPHRNRRIPSQWRPTSDRLTLARKEPTVMISNRDLDEPRNADRELPPLSEGEFYDLYRWCLNPLLTVDQLFQRIRQEL